MLLPPTVPPAASSAPSLSVIVPALNEAARIPPTLDASLAYLRGTGRAWEVIIVDDGSEDGTVAACRARHAGEARLRLLRSRINQGKGAALQAGAAAARGERLLFMDADGGTPLSALPLLENVMAAAGCDVVVGSRVQQHRPWHRRLMGSTFSIMAAPLTGVRDSQCGFKLLTREAAAATMPQLRTRRWAFDVELLQLARRHRLGVEEVPVPACDVPGSHMEWCTPAQMAWDVLKLYLRLGVRGDADPAPRDHAHARSVSTRGATSCRYVELDNAAGGPSETRDILRLD